MGTDDPGARPPDGDRGRPRGGAPRRRRPVVAWRDPNDCRQARTLVTTAVGLFDVLGLHERKLCATEGAISSLGSLGRVVQDEESCHPQQVVLKEGPVE